MTATLHVENLSLTLRGRQLLHNLSFTLEPGKRLGIIGGSGSGKTLTALTLAGLQPEGAEITGTATFDGVDLLDPQTNIRGDRIGFVFQEPKTALDPLKRLGHQMTAALNYHYDLSRAERREAALRLAARVGFNDPQRMVRAFPHEVSGGQRQRAAIAAAISASPDLIIADEPTTALDVTVQANILNLFHELSETDCRSLLFISHDLAAVSQVAHEVIVLDDGRIVEHGTLADTVQRPKHPVTRELIRAAGGDV